MEQRAERIHGQDTGLLRFARELRLVVIAGPTVNIITGVAALASRHVLSEPFGLMQLAIGVWNLIPSVRHNAPLGNDGNIAFRVCKDRTLLQKLYFESMDSATE